MSSIVLSTAYSAWAAFERVKKDACPMGFVFFFSNGDPCNNVSVQAFELTFYDGSTPVLVKNGAAITFPQQNRLLVILTDADKAVLAKAQYTYTLFNVTNQRTEVQGTFSWQKGRTTGVGVLTPPDLKVEYSLVSGEVSVAGLIITGQTGPAWLTPKGNWQANTLYKAGDGVLYDGSTYRRKATGQSGSVFDVSQWDIVAQGGIMPDKSVTSQKLADASVLPGKTSFFVRGKNIFDKNQTFLLNSRINSGMIQENPSFESKVSDFIPVEPLTSYIHDNAGDRPYILYDANKNQVASGGQWNKDGHPITTTANTAYLRFQLFNNDNLALTQVEKGSVKTAYEPFTYSLADEHLTKAILKSELPLDTVVTKAILSTLLGDTSRLIHSMTGKNLFNKATVTPGHLGGDGIVNAGSAGTYITSDFIPVEPNTTYSTSHNFFLYWYNSQKVCLSGMQETGSGVHPVSPVGAVYARVTCYLAQVNAFQFEKGATSTGYEAFAYSIPDDLLSKYAKLNQIPDVSGYVSRSVGKNLFNPNQVFLEHSRIDSGMIQENPSFDSKVSDFIPVEPLTSYVHESVGGRNWMFFDANKSLISSGGNWYRPNNYITSPAGAKYMRVQLDNNDNISRVQIEKGTAFSYFEAYRQEINAPLNRNQVTSVIPGLTNRISLTSKVYVKKGQEDQIYFRPVVWRWLEAFNFRFSNMTNGKTRAIVTTNADLFTTFSVYDADFDVVATKGVTLIAADMTRDTGNFKLLAMGDSYTDPGAWLVYVKNNIPNITLLGIKGGHPNNPFPTPNEGRSGWTLQAFMLTKHDPSGYFSPFLQPIDPYNYYGGTAGWKTARQNSTSPLYTTSLGFDASTGYRTNPNVNDVMWVDVNNRYERWSGSAWVAITETSLNFSFNFAKYRSVWGIALPNLFTFMLGINDFSGMHWRDVAAAFVNFKAQLDQVIASVKADNSSIKFAIMLPTTAFGDIENQNDVFTPSRNAAMFIQRELLIANYDNRENEGIYVIDAGSAMDPDFAYHKDFLLPFPEYVTEVGWNEQKRHSSRDSIHPDTGYQQIGKRVATFIQAIR